MKTSETIEKLALALCSAQGEMGGAVKGSANPFFKTSYADLTSVIRVIKEPCFKNGLSYIQFPIRNENGVGVVTRLMHTSGQWLESEYTLPIQKLDAQSAGACVTYARRFALQALFGIPSVDNDGEDLILRAVKEVISADQYLTLVDMLAETKSDVERFKKAFNVEDLEQFPKASYQKAMTLLEGKKANAGK
jgi:hypothetical protein